jgi:hypothetical protein
MNSEHTEEFSQAPVSQNVPVPANPTNVTIVNELPPATRSRQDATDPRDDKPGEDKSRNETTGEKTGDMTDDKTSNAAAQKPKQPKPKGVSEAKVKMRSRLPALDDDGDVGVEKEQIVTRDGKSDLGFTGTLLASAGPGTAPKKDDWQEYRVYQTNGGKHVFSKVTRSILADKDDSYEADVYDPSPSSVPSQLFRSARELVHSRPFTWKDAAVAFFGYDPLAKALYRKLSVEFEEQIT